MTPRGWRMLKPLPTHTMKNDSEIVDIAEHLAAEREIPRGRRYRIQIDREFYVVDRECLTGRDLLLLAGKNPPERWQLTQKFRFGRTEKVELDEKVDLATCGVERFVTLPLDSTEGRPPRKDFFLPEADTAWLNSLGLAWEALIEGKAQWLILRNWPLPPGYNVAAADVALCINGGYPVTQIDMVYFFPALHLPTHRKPINKLSPHAIEGKTYQRWSRHRTRQNPWRAGLDDLSSHMALVSHWLEREIAQ
jgi:hypothetical protein